MQAVGVPARSGGVRLWLDRAALAAVGVALLAVGAVASAVVLGYRPLLVRSGSMAPAIHTGDVVLSRLVEAREISVGDVVTFRDPTRDQRLITLSLIHI